MSDQIAHVIEPALTRSLGEPVMIERKPGGNGAPAAVEVACSAPDGRTLFMGTMSTHALAPHFAESLPYDALSDFAPVSLVARSPLVLGCSREIDAATTAELVSIARKNPGALAYGTSSFGGAPHLAAELFAKLADIRLRYVRYDETERLYADLESGRIALSFNNIMSMLPRCRAGRVRALAVTTAGRSAAAPELPTVIESGVAGCDVSNWLGLLAPRATPAGTVEHLSRAVSAAVRMPEVASAFRDAGVDPHGSTPDEFHQFISTELARWQSVIARIKKEQA
jgi:tripartite-type tricarboxylate transporter receptor subunit TctC